MKPDPQQPSRKALELSLRTWEQMAETWRQIAEQAQRAGNTQRKRKADEKLAECNGAMGRLQQQLSYLACAITPKK